MSVLVVCLVVSRRLVVSPCLAVSSYRHLPSDNYIAKLSNHCDSPNCCIVVSPYLTVVSQYRRPAEISLTDVSPYRRLAKSPSLSYRRIVVSPNPLTLSYRRIVVSLCLTPCRIAVSSPRHLSRRTVVWLCRPRIAVSPSSVSLSYHRISCRRNPTLRYTRPPARPAGLPPVSEKTRSV